MTSEPYENISGHTTGVWHSDKAHKKKLQEKRVKWEQSLYGNFNGINTQVATPEQKKAKAHKEKLAKAKAAKAKAGKAKGAATANANRHKKLKNELKKIRIESETYKKGFKILWLHGSRIMMQEEHLVLLRKLGLIKGDKGYEVMT